MKEEQVERRLKAELDFFKVYAVFIIGLVTGDVNQFNTFIRTGDIHSLIILIAGITVLMFFVGACIQSYIKIKKLTTNS